jgi:hypothetical protein
MREPDLRVDRAEEPVDAGIARRRNRESSLARCLSGWFADCIGG